ncbi:hypothetical protein ACIBCN_41440 [Nocardia sp. NPDC051052]|uniref:hypothetical protein n=1 Tax=Nocardia sp. NPDC051052 TaxID=3364322 RepID=UPI0037931768
MKTGDQTPLICYQEMTRASWRQFRPTTDGHVAAVSVDRRSQLALMDRRPSPSEIYYRPPAGVYWVDVSVHHAMLHLELPTAEGVFAFRAAIDVAWRISDPVRAVKDGVKLCEPIYRPFLERKLRDMSQEFEVGSFADAERHINTYFADRAVDLPSGVAMVRCIVKLAPEDSARNHIQQRTFDRHKAERRNAEHKAHLHGAELQHDWNTTAHGLAMQSLAHGQETAAVEQRHREELEQQRIAHYTSALQTGGIGVLALQLASSPADVSEVVQIMLHQKQLDLESARDVLNTLMEQRLITRRDVQDVMAPISKVIADRLNPTASLAHREPLPELAAPPVGPVGQVEESEGLDEDESDHD